MFTYTAFENFKIIAQGNIEEVALAVKKRTQQQKQETSILIFSDLTGRQIDFDLSGSEKQTLDRLKIYTSKDIPATTGAGRPKLGVVPREISLLPKHWEWLLHQDGGASAVIRQLIDEKIKIKPSDKIKLAQERTYKFLSALAGNLENFEEATRYLYRKDKDKFKELISNWPKDVAKHSMTLAKEVF